MKSYKIKSKAEYKRLRSKYDARDKALKTYFQKTGRNWVDEKAEKTYNIPKGTTNEQTSAIEVYEYKNKPLKKGQKYFGYLSMDGRRITTFTGDTLADVSFLKETKSRGYKKHYSFEGRDINEKKIKGRAYAGKDGYVRFKIV